MVSQSTYPTTEQAVILDAVEGTPVREYTLAFGNMIGPQNIHYVSRISNQRICFYLASKELAEKLTEEKTIVKVRDSLLMLRPLISKSKRIIILNVHPAIPNFVIENELKKTNITPVSQITPLRAGMHDVGFTHIMCFRRQMYVQPTDVNNIPQNLQIQYNNTNHWIYFSGDKRICYRCNEEGHYAVHCKNIENIIPLTNPSEFPPNGNEENKRSSQISNSSNKNVDITVEQDKHDEISQEEEHNQEQSNNINVNISSIINEKNGTSSNDDFPAKPTPLTTQKRQLPSNSSVTLSQTESLASDTEDDYKIVTRRDAKKKIKVHVKPTIDEIREKCQIAIDSMNSDDNVNKNTYPIKLDSLFDYIASTYGESNVSEIALRYTKQIHTCYHAK